MVETSRPPEVRHASSCARPRKTRVDRHRRHHCQRDRRRPHGRGRSASAAPNASTSCDAAATGFTPVLQLDLPERANYLNTTPPYSLDRTADVGSNFDRVGYCLELNGPDGPQWVWTAMEPFTNDARRLGLPTHPGELVRQRVGDLDVQSNVPGVTNGPGQTGYLEMWPNQYQESASTQVANASPITYDVDDNPTLEPRLRLVPGVADRRHPAVDPRRQTSFLGQYFYRVNQQRAVARHRHEPGRPARLDLRQQREPLHAAQTHRLRPAVPGRA